MKTQIDLRENVMYVINERTAQQGRAMREQESEYIRNGLNQPAPSGRPVSDLGLPLIPMRSDAPLTQMTRDDIVAFEAAVLSDEDVDQHGA